MRKLIKENPVPAFIVIAFGWTWPLAALIEQSLIFPVLGLFGPCVAAIIVIWASRGRSGLAQLGNKFRLTRALLPWCLVAALLPLVLLVPIWLLHAAWWTPSRVAVEPLSFLGLTLAVLIVGEEIGWRGFLLPYFLERYSPLISSLIVGIVWAVWHLPNFLLPNFPHHGLPFTAFVIMTLGFSVLFTWFFMNTAGSLVIAVIFHAALNLFSLSGLEPARVYWLKAAVYSLAALAATWVIGRSRSWPNTSKSAA